MPAAITWYATNSKVSVHTGMSETSPGADATASPVAGWIVSTGATNHSAFFAQVERADTTFANTTPPSGTIDTTNGDCLRSVNPYTTTFTAGNWNVHFTAIAVTNGGAQDGRMRCRLFKSANANGSGATEITAAHQQGGLVTNLATSAQQTSTATFNPGAFSVNNEYIFVQLAWERTGAGGMTSADVNMRIGTTATRVISTPRKDTLTKTFTLDAVVKKSDTTKECIVDAIVKKSDITKTFASDATIQKAGQTKTFAADAIAIQTVTKAVAVDALVAQPVSITLATVNHYGEPISFIFSAIQDESFVDIENGDTPLTVDGLVSGQQYVFTFANFSDQVFQGATNVDGYISGVTVESWGGWGYVTVPNTLGANLTPTITAQYLVGKTFTADAIAKKTQSKTFAADSLLKASSLTKACSIDAVLVHEVSITLQSVDHYGDAVTGLFSAIQDESFVEIESGSTPLTVNDLVSGTQYVFTFSNFGVYILQSISNPDGYTVDFEQTAWGGFGYVTVPNSAGSNFDITITGHYLVGKTFDVDANLAAHLTKTCTMDALVQKQNQRMRIRYEFYDEPSPPADNFYDFVNTNPLLGYPIVGGQLIREGSPLVGKILKKISFYLNTDKPAAQEILGDPLFMTAGVFDFDGNLITSFGTYLWANLPSIDEPTALIEFENGAEHVLQENEVIGFTYYSELFVGVGFRYSLSGIKRTDSDLYDLYEPGNFVDDTSDLAGKFVEAAESTTKIDAILALRLEKTFALDALVKKSDQTKTCSIDAMLVQSQTKALDIDAILSLSGSKATSIDALVKKTLDKSASVDALVQQQGSKSIDIDAILSLAGEKTLAADALLKKSQAKTFTVDALAAQTTTKSLDVDGILQQARSKDFAADALLRTTLTKAFAINAILETAGQTVTKTFTVDAELQRTQSAPTGAGPMTGRGRTTKKPATKRRITSWLYTSPTALPPIQPKTTTLYKLMADIKSDLTLDDKQRVRVIGRLAKNLPAMASIKSTLKVGKSLATAQSVTVLPYVSAEAHSSLSIVMMSPRRVAAVAKTTIALVGPKRSIKSSLLSAGPSSVILSASQRMISEMDLSASTALRLGRPGNSRRTPPVRARSLVSLQVASVWIVGHVMLPLGSTTELVSESVDTELDRLMAFLDEI